MAQSHPPYPAEFRHRLVDLVRAGRSPEELAEKFEPTAQSIRNWEAQADRDDGVRADGLTTEEREELRRLRREVKTLREEREILKKCMVRPRRCKRDQRTGAPSAPMYSASVWGAKHAPGQDGNPHAPVLKSHTASKAAFFIRVSGAPFGR